MSGSCCGGLTKSEPVKAGTTVAPEAVAVKSPVARSDNSECCNEKSAKSEKQGCGC